MAIDTEQLKKLIEEEDKKVLEDEDYLRKIIDPEDMDEESGIRSLNKKMASDPDPRAERNNLKENLSREYFGKELNELSEDDVILIENMIDEMTVKKKGSGSMKMAYEPGDYNKDNYDPMMVEEYEKYKYEMNEQRPGMPIMSIDEFIRMEKGSARRKAPSIKLAEIDPLQDDYNQYVFEMEELGQVPVSFDQYREQVLAEARMGVMGGGIMRAKLKDGSSYKFMELIDKDYEDKLYDAKAEQLDRKYNPKNYPPSQRAMTTKQVMEMIEKAKKDKEKKAKGRIAGI